MADCSRGYDVSGSNGNGSGRTNRLTQETLGAAVIVIVTFLFTVASGRSGAINAYGRRCIAMYDQLFPHDGLCWVDKDLRRQQQQQQQLLSSSVAYPLLTHPTTATAAAGTAPRKQTTYRSNHPSIAIYYATIPGILTRLRFS